MAKNYSNFLISYKSVARVHFALINCNQCIVILSRSVPMRALRFEEYCSEDNFSLYLVTYGWLIVIWMVLMICEQSLLKCWTALSKERSRNNNCRVNSNAQIKANRTFYWNLKLMCSYLLYDALYVIKIDDWIQMQLFILILQRFNVLFDTFDENWANNWENAGFLLVFSSKSEFSGMFLA